MRNPLECNRVILCHFDSYSALLLFARFGGNLLLPEAAPESAEPGPAAEATDMEQYAPAAVSAAVAERYGLSREELVPVPQFDEWLSTPTGRLRVHLLRIKSFAPPKEPVDKHGGKWKPVSELRGIPAHELGYARRIFDIIMGG